MSDTRRVVPTRENVCAVVVTYFPDGAFSERLARIRQQVAKVIVIDNTGGTEMATPLRCLNGTDTDLIRNEQNCGVGMALNMGVARAVQLGYQWVISFDQDSWIYDNLLASLVAICEQQTSPQRVGIIGSNFEDEGTHTPFLKSPSPGAIFRKAETVITSGSLLSADTFATAGPFRSDFFIDSVDHEYCLRLRKLGYEILISESPLMLHALGTGTKLTIETLGRKLSVVLTNRSPLRRYYMTRNAILVARDYFFVAPRWVLRSLASVVGFALLKIPFEKCDRWKKLHATAYGVFDGLRSRTGRIDAAQFDK